MFKPTIAAGFPKAFIDFAALRGADPQLLRERSGIGPDDLTDPNKRVPLANYLDLLRAGIEFCNEPALALLFGEEVRMQDISIVGLLGEVVESVEAGRQQLKRYLPLVVDMDSESPSDWIELVPAADGNVWLRFTSTLYSENPLITESAFSRCVCGARAMFASAPDCSFRPFPKAIHFTYEEPSYRAQYDRIFGVPLSFGSHMNAFLMDGEFLASYKPPRTNPYLSQILMAHAEELLQRLGSAKTTRGRVEALLTPLLYTGEASMEMIVAKLGCSRHTLFRKLRAEGVTFEKVLDELRHKLALEYLNGKKVSVNETAYLLGFSDAAAFSRAFKRWTGSSPGLWKRESA